MAIDWGLQHLEQCIWYLDCPKNKIPISEITFQNRIKLGFLKLPLAIVEEITKKKPTIARKDSSKPIMTHKGKYKAQPLEGEATDHLVGDNILNLGLITIVNPSSNVLFLAASFALLGTPSKWVLVILTKRQS
jgi:hypothetical protein